MDWIREHTGIVIMAGISLGVAVLGFVGGLLFVAMMPADTLTPKHRPRHPMLRIARGVIGWVLVVAGSVMLVVPGPGLVVLVIGAMLAEFPGRRRLQRWVLSREHIIRPVNRLRRRFGREPVQAEELSAHG